MKKIMVVFMVVALFGWGLLAVSQAEAADPSATITVTVTVRHISVTLTNAAVDFTTVNLESETVSSKVDVANSGNVAETYSLQLTTVDVYTASTSETGAGTDIYVLEALFLPNAAATPGTGDFGADTGDDDVVLSASATTASATAYGLSGSANGLSVAAGDERDLYFNYGAPTVVTTGVEENLTVTITAVAA